MDIVGIGLRELWNTIVEKWYLVLALGVILLILFMRSSMSQIPEDEALTKFREQAGTTDVVIVSMTSNDPVVGKPNDVYYTLRINGQIAKGRCIRTATTSSMECYLIEGGVPQPVWSPELAPR